MIALRIPKNLIFFILANNHKPIQRVRRNSLNLCTFNLKFTQSLIISLI